MKKYPKYKDSGIEWIGEIPEHWELKKIKHVSKKIGDGLHGTPEYVDHSDYYFINGNNIKDNNIEISEQTKCVSQKEYLKNLKPLTLNTILLSINGTIGNLALYQNEQIMLGKSVGYIDIIDIFNRSYIYHYLSSDVSRNLFEIELSGSTIKNLSLNSINNHSIPIPSSKEQAYIAEFLNTKTGEIEKSIDIKLRLIDLLKEERTAIINHAVTKGLNPKVKLKSTSVEWIGDIPEHWGRVKLKLIVSTKICDGPHETPDWTTEGIPFLSAESIKGNKLDFNYKRGYISLEQHRIYSRKSKVLKGDILFCKSGSTTGKSALVECNDEFGIWSPLAIIRANDRHISNLFLFQFMQSDTFRLQVETAWTFGTQPNIGMGSLENLWVTVPLIDEQKQIVEYLEIKTSEIDTIISKTEKEIDLLNEYKTALISEVVTGKVDVREEVIV